MRKNINKNMITEETIDKYKNATQTFADHIGFPIEILHNLEFDQYTKYFDTKGLFIGITCDPDGIFWIAEVCSQPLGTCNSRESAQELAILECFKLMEEMVEFEVK